MKRKLLFIATIVLCLALVTSGTLAYFSSDVVTHNVITSGNVSIKLEEWADPGLTQEYQNNKTGILPGTTVGKYANITNDGPNPVWVRVRFKTSIQLSKENPLAHVNGDLEKPLIDSDLSLLSLKMPAGTWLEQDGWYYYNAVLRPNASVLALESVSFSKTMGNAYQGSSASVDIEVQAVQSAHNPETPKTTTPVLEAAGWPKSNP